MAPRRAALQLASMLLAVALLAALPQAAQARRPQPLVLPSAASGSSAASGGPSASSSLAAASGPFQHVATVHSRHLSQLPPPGGPTVKYAPCGGNELTCGPSPSYASMGGNGERRGRATPGVTARGRDRPRRPTRLLPRPPARFSLPQARPSAATR